MTNNTKQNLPYILSAYFDADVVTDYEGIKQFLNHQNFPMRNSEFKRELASAILQHEISPEEYEDLTNHELETQEEVDDFLKTEIWQPLYGDQPITY